MKLGQRVKYYDCPLVYDATVIDIGTCSVTKGRVKIRFTNVCGKQEKWTSFAYADLGDLCRAIAKDIELLEDSKNTLEKEIQYQEAQCVS